GGAGPSGAAWKSSRKAVGRSSTSGRSCVRSGTTRVARKSWYASTASPRRRRCRDPAGVALGGGARCAHRALRRSGGRPGSGRVLRGDVAAADGRVVFGTAPVSAALAAPDRRPARPDRDRPRRVARAGLLRAPTAARGPRAAVVLVRLCAVDGRTLCDLPLSRDPDRLPLGPGRIPLHPRRHDAPRAISTLCLAIAGRVD